MSAFDEGKPLRGYEIPVGSADADNSFVYTPPQGEDPEACAALRRMPPPADPAALPARARALLDETAPLLGSALDPIAHLFCTLLSSGLRVLLLGRWSQGKSETRSALASRFLDPEQNRRLALLMQRSREENTYLRTDLVLQRSSHDGGRIVCTDGRVSSLALARDDELIQLRRLICGETIIGFPAPDEIDRIEFLVSPRTPAALALIEGLEARGIPALILVDTPGARGNTQVHGTIARAIGDAHIVLHVTNTHGESSDEIAEFIDRAAAMGDRPFLRERFIRVVTGMDERTVQTTPIRGRELTALATQMAKFDLEGVVMSLVSNLYYAGLGDRSRDLLNAIGGLVSQAQEPLRQGLIDFCAGGFGVARLLERIARMGHELLEGPSAILHALARLAEVTAEEHMRERLRRARAIVPRERDERRECLHRLTQVAFAEGDAIPFSFPVFVPADSELEQLPNGSPTRAVEVRERFRHVLYRAGERNLATSDLDEDVRRTLVACVPYLVECIARDAGGLTSEQGMRRAYARSLEELASRCAEALAAKRRSECVLQFERARRFAAETRESHPNDALRLEQAILDLLTLIDPKQAREYKRLLEQARALVGVVRAWRELFAAPPVGEP
jgi:hypothetical protein